MLIVYFHRLTKCRELLRNSLCLEDSISSKLNNWKKKTFKVLLTFDLSSVHSASRISLWRRWRSSGRTRAADELELGKVGVEMVDSSVNLFLRGSPAENDLLNIRSQNTRLMRLLDYVRLWMCDCLFPDLQSLDAGEGLGALRGVSGTEWAALSCESPKTHIGWMNMSFNKQFPEFFHQIMELLGMTHYV